jgi:hypothetical protein
VRLAVPPDRAGPLPGAAVLLAGLAGAAGLPDAAQVVVEGGAERVQVAVHDDKL